MPAIGPDVQTAPLPSSSARRCVAARRFFMLLLLAMGLVASPGPTRAQDATAPAGDAGPEAADVSSQPRQPAEPTIPRPDRPEDVNRNADAEADAQSPPGQVGPAPQPRPSTIAPALPPKLANVIPAGGRVVIVPVEGLIYDYTLVSLRRRVEAAKQQQADVVVLRIRSDGGLVSSALDISRYLKGLQIPTIAWIDDKAYSGGIMIAAACDAIVMHPSSVVGNSAPIALGESLSPTERAKALSPVLADYRDSAKSNGYDFAIFHAMAALGVELYLVEDPRTGDRRVVNQLDYAYLVQGRDPTGAAAPQPAPPPPTLPAQPGAASPDAAVDPSVAGPQREVGGPADQGQWRLVRKIHDGQTLLTVDQTVAEEIGLSSSSAIRTEADLEQYLGAANTVTIQQTWSQGLAYWLSTPVVKGILIVILLLAAYIEFQTPGLGIAGAVAVASLLLLIGAPYLVGLADVWHLVLIGIGVIFLLAEIFITPGFGAFGIAGILCMLTGIILIGVPTPGQSTILPTREMYDRLTWSAMWTMAGIVASIAGFALLTRYFGSIPGLNLLVLRNPEPAPDGPAAPTVSGDDSLGGGAIQPGDEGVVVSGLRPTGRAEIDGRIIDVISDGQWIETGQRIRVAEVHGNRIVVASAASFGETAAG